LKRAALLALFALIGVSLISCYKGSYIPKPPSGLYERVLASQDVSSLTSSAGLVIVNGQLDVLPPVSPIGAGGSPGLMTLSPTRATLLVFDSSSNQVEIVDTAKESVTGAVQLAGPTTSIVIPSTTTIGYVAVPTAPLIGSSPGAVEVIDLTTGTITDSISVPAVQTIVSNQNGTQLLAFSSDSDAVTIVSPLNINTTNPVTTTVPGFDRPVYGFFGADGSTAYILNCGAQCTGKQASVQILNLGIMPSAGASVAVDGATVGLISGSMLFVAGTSPTNNACTGETTAATVCGRLDIVDLGSLTVTGSAVITNGYHTVMSLSANGQLFIGASGCTTVGNVNNPQGEVRGCLSIYNTTNGQVVIPPDNGDVTDLQSFTSRYVEYVAEGGSLRVYDTTRDILLVENVNGTILNGTIAINGVVIGVKAIDFF
jgi:hypothetical protein